MLKINAGNKNHLTRMIFRIISSFDPNATSVGRLYITPLRHLSTASSNNRSSSCEEVDIRDRLRA
jgi:hypothetical protein